MSDPTDEIDSHKYWAPYDHRLAFELALGLYPLAEILERYNTTPEQMQQLMAMPTFKEQIIAYKREIKEKGLSFREKAKIMAEDLLGTAYELIHHPACAPPVKADLIKWVARVAALEPGPQTQQPADALPAIIDRLKALPDEDLEVRVTQIVKRRENRERVVDGDVVTLQ